MEDLTRIFLNALLTLYQFLGDNFGLSIIVFTIIVRLALFPLNKMQMDSAKKMQDLQARPDWIKTQEKYKNDKQKLSAEQMKIYNEVGISPWSGCLTLFIMPIQFLIIIPMYQSITRALAASPSQLLVLYQDVVLPEASRLLPLNSHFLWMDLSLPERLYLDFLPFGIPVLAILVAITSFLQTKLMSPTTSAGGGNDQAQAMTKMMSWYLPLIMAYFSYTYAGGLALYFVTGNLATIIQYALMGRLDFKNLFSKKAK